jgi:hypothetical protein
MSRSFYRKKLDFLTILATNRFNANDIPPPLEALSCRRHRFSVHRSSARGEFPDL